MSAGYKVHNVENIKAVQDENNFVIELSKQDPDQVIPVCGIPYHSTKALQEIKRCGEIGAKGIKLNAFDLDVRIGKSMIDLTKGEDFVYLTSLLKAATENNLFIILHSWYLTGKGLFFLSLEAAKNFPSMRLILAHGLRNFKDLHDIVVVREEYKRNNLVFPEIVVDLSYATDFFYTNSNPELISWTKTLKYFGIDNIVFGSDMPSVGETSFQNHLDFLEKYFDEKDRLKIRSTNINRILNEKDESK